MSKYLVRFWVDVSVEAESKEDAKNKGNKLQKYVGIEEPWRSGNFGNGIQAEEYDTQFAGVIKEPESD